MINFNINDKEWNFNNRINDILLITPTKSSIIINKNYINLIDKNNPKVEELIQYMKINNNVLTNKKNDNYFNTWHHTYQTGIHWINCEDESNIPNEYNQKCTNFNQVDIQKTPSLYQTEKFHNFIRQNKLELVYKHSISLYFRFEDDLLMHIDKNKIIRALTENQLQNADIIGVTSLYPRGSVKKGYFYILDVVLMKHKKTL